MMKVDDDLKEEQFERQRGETKKNG